MKIVFVSDIHGCYARLAPVLDFFDRSNADMLCIGGDIINYGPRNGIPPDGLNPAEIADALNKRKSNIIAVRGNCDSEVDQMLLHFPIMSDFALVADGRRSFLLTHGHLFNADDRPLWAAADVIVSGHTHFWRLEREASGSVILNTGSITFPKGGNVPTFAFYDGDELSVLTLDRKVLKSLTF